MPSSVKSCYIQFICYVICCISTRCNCFVFYFSWKLSNIFRGIIFSKHANTVLSLKRNTLQLFSLHYCSSLVMSDTYPSYHNNPNRYYK